MSDSDLLDGPEMTGLDPVDLIIEIATVVTDAHLNLLAQGPVLAITSRIVLSKMDDWNQTTHSQIELDRSRRQT